MNCKRQESNFLLSMVQLVLPQYRNIYIFCNKKILFCTFLLDMFTLRIRREVIRSPSWISSLVSFNRAVNKRFGRLESHVVTLARSVAHLSSELRSQASLSQDVDDMRRQVQDQQLKTKEEGDPAKESAQLQSRVKKLKRYFLTVYFYSGLS